MSGTTIFLILDAFRHDYLSEEHTPTLSKMAEEGTYGRQLQSTSGFTQRSGLFTGTHPDVHRNYTMFTYEPDDSPYSILRGLSYISDLLEANDMLDTAIRRFIAQPLVDKLSDANNAPVARIPYNVLPKMSVSEGQKQVYAAGALGSESIFDKMQSTAIEFEYLVYPDVSTDEELTKQLISEINQSNPKDLYLGQFISSDRDVHKAGVDSDERIEITQTIDEQIRRIRDACEENLDEYNLCIVGDHGMMNVDTYVDVFKKVTHRAQSAGLQLGTDYLLFLDSTLARFWFFSEKAKTELTDLVEEELADLGRVIEEEEASSKRISLERRYGDLIWEANPGVLIYPDYFHETEKYNAMHGYDRTIEEMQGFAVVSGTGTSNTEFAEVDLVDICPTLCDLIDVGYPKQNEGKSLSNR